MCCGDRIERVPLIVEPTRDELRRDWKRPPRGWTPQGGGNAGGIQLQQSDTGFGCPTGAYCSGRSANGSTAGRIAKPTAAKGSTAVTITMNASAATLWAVNLGDWAPGGNVTWAAGNWIVRLNITTAITGPTWEECYICRASAGCASQATIGSVTAQAISLATTGVKSVTISGAAQTPAAGDVVEIVLVFSNSQTMTRAFAFTPDQLIDTPFVELATGYGANVGQAVNRGGTF
jgi:hypothetical protein